ncbi:MAG: DNA-formamidopyrimidine glycosylase family protein [Acidimicrobiales bacterium]
MPELIEIEAYRKLADEVVGRRVTGVEAPDAWYLKGGLTDTAISDALVGRTVVGDRRIGKLLLLELDDDHTLGLRFGMTGRLLVDGLAAIERLEYSSGRQVDAWDRFRLRFAVGGDLRMRDPRRLGGVFLDPDVDRMGFEASTVTAGQLARVIGSSVAPLKARLMDQTRLAGLGNLLSDEILFRAGLDPARPAGSLTDTERRRLHRVIRRTLAQLTERGGSHTGDFQVARVAGATCPRDGAPIQRRIVGGRATYSCPEHQV